jgi:hypothetical protein
MPNTALEPTPTVLEFCLCVLVFMFSVVLRVTLVGVAQNHRTYVTERVFGYQRFTKALCATFCATFGVETWPQMATQKKWYKMSLE